MNLAWTPGLNNFEFVGLQGNNGPRIFARLNNRGAVEATFGCANGVGTVGVPYAGIPPAIGPFNPIVGPGNNCGTDPVEKPAGQGWGFKMTTGTISGSDDFPFSDETTALGTPFLPNRVVRTAMQGFFFTRMGDDSVVGTVRNLVLLGGSVTVDPSSGNVFNRVTSLRMRLQVPEPAGAAGLLVGAGALLAFARRRRYQPEGQRTFQRLRRRSRRPRREPDPGAARALAVRLRNPLVRNPRLVVVSVSCFGQTGPLAAEPAQGPSPKPSPASPT